MNTGGTGRDNMMILLPLVAVTLLITIVMGGPEEALSVADRMLYDAWNAVSLWWRY